MNMIFHSVSQKVRKHQTRKLLSHIENADDILIQQIIQTVIRRYGIVFPEWEVVFYSLPKEPNQRRQEIQALIQFLQTHEM